MIYRASLTTITRHLAAALLNLACRAGEAKVMAGSNLTDERDER